MGELLLGVHGMAWHGMSVICDRASTTFCRLLPPGVYDCFHVRNVDGPGIKFASLAPTSACSSFLLGRFEIQPAYFGTNATHHNQLQY